MFSKLVALWAIAACLLPLSALSEQQVAVQASSAYDQSFARSLSNMPVSFTKNMGQWPDSILFRAEAGGATMWFTKDGIYYQFTRRIPKPVTGEAALAVGLGPRRPDTAGKLGREPGRIETAIIKAEFVGSSKNAQVFGLDELDCKSNYYLGNDPGRWRSGVPSYAAIFIRGLYPGVDLSFRGANGRFTCQVTADSPAKLASVRTRYTGAPTVATLADGRALLQTALGQKVFNGVMLEVDGSSGTGRSMSTSPNSLVLAYSTCLGGSGADCSVAIAVDGVSSAHVAGYTGSVDFPTQAPYQTDPGDGNDDVFVTKLSGTGKTLLYSTYLGGGDLDAASAIALDASGNAYVAGMTRSTNFPTLNPYQTDPGDFSSDVFVTKLSPAGALVYSTYLGGASSDGAEGIAVDQSGYAYVAGGTDSYNYPTQGAYQSDQAYRDAFVTKLSLAGNSLVYSTYLGGGDVEAAGAIAVDDYGSAYVTGWTSSSNYPTVNPYQTNLDASYDVIVTKLSAMGNSLIYSTYLAGSGEDWGMSIKVDGQRNAYVVGYTASSDFPTQTPYQTYQGPLGAAFGDGFVTKLSFEGNSLVYGTYLGGSGDDAAVGISVDGSGNAYVTGTTWSADFPTVQPFQTDGDGAVRDAFVTKLFPGGNSPEWSTYLGGTGDEFGYTIAANNAGHAFVTGYTYSPDFPTASAYQTYQAAGDAYVTKLILGCCTGTTGNVNMTGIVDLSDLSMLIAYLTASPRPVLPCPAEANVNATGIIDLADLSLLIAYLTATPKPTLPNCP